jgi:hypothetical protein
MGYSARPDFKVQSFIDAEHRYNTITPIRGTTIRPLGDRRGKHIHIVKEDDDTYECYYYNTAVATFHRDGWIVYRTDGYNTISTANIITAFAPYGYYACKYKNIIQMYHDEKYYIVENGFTYNTITGELSGLRTPTKQLVDRAATKEKREATLPFLQFARGFMEVLNMDVPYDDNRVQKFHAMRDFKNDPSSVSEDQYLDLLSAFVYEDSWNGNWGKSFKQVKSKIQRVFTVYREVEIPIGSLQK